MNHKKLASRPVVRSASKAEKCQTYTPVFSIVFLPTLACNCSCTYCFEKLDGCRIDNRNWEKIFSKMLELAKKVRCRTLRVYWQGGEVLSLSPDSVQRGLNVAAAVFSNSNVILEHHLQTNLLLYDTLKWKDVLAEFCLGTLSSSLDFPNLYRSTSSLSPEEYTRAWLQKKATAEKDGFTVSVVSLPNSETLKFGAERFYRFFKEKVRIKNLQVNLPFPSWKGGLKPLDLGELAHFMVELYEVWLDSDRDLNLSPFNRLEDRLLYNRGTLHCMWTYSCANSLLAIGPNGEVGQCDCWISSLKEFNFGSLIEQPIELILDSTHRRIFLDRPLKLMQVSGCGECQFWKTCHGGCPVRAITFTGDVLASDYYCPVYYAMFSAVLENAGRLNQHALA